MQQGAHFRKGGGDVRFVLPAGCWTIIGKKDSTYVLPSRRPFPIFKGAKLSLKGTLHIERLINFENFENFLLITFDSIVFLTTNFVMKVEVWRGKDVAAVAKELTVLAENNDLRGHGLVWKDQTSHEDGIKVSIFPHTSNLFPDMELKGEIASVGAWLQLTLYLPISL
jgi:hypothetical protein